MDKILSLLHVLNLIADFQSIILALIKGPLSPSLQLLHRKLHSVTRSNHNYHNPCYYIEVRPIWIQTTQEHPKIQCNCRRKNCNLQMPTDFFPLHALSRNPLGYKKFHSTVLLFKPRTGIQTDIKKRPKANLPRCLLCEGIVFLLPCLFIDFWLTVTEKIN